MLILLKRINLYVIIKKISVFGYKEGKILSAVLKTSSLCKKIGRRQIIQDLSIEANAGEVFGFLGPNGAGKTTTIKMIVGLYKITSGSIEICGHSVSGDFEKAIANVGAIIEEPRMYGYMTGMENLKYYAGMYKGISQKRISDMVEQFGMQERIDTKVKTYSLGMRQRLGLIQAMLHEPKLLILDEPTNGLDPKGIHELREFLKYAAHQLGVCVFVSSHLLSEMQLLCDRVGIIDQGRLIKVMGISEINGLTVNGSEVIINVDRPDTAAQILSEGGWQGVGIGAGFISVSADREQVPQIISMLTGGGILVYGVSQDNSNSLESLYMQLTGGSKIE